MHVISLFHHLLEGGSLEERKTPRFLIYIPFFCLYRGGQSGRKEDTKIFNLHSFFLPR